MAMRAAGLIVAAGMLLVSCQRAEPPRRTVEVTGSAEIQVVPDRMGWSIIIEVKAPTVADARGQLDAAIAKVHELLDSYKDAMTDAQLSGVEIRRDDLWATRSVEKTENGETVQMNIRERVPQYECKRTLTFQLTDLAKYESLVSEAAAIPHVSFPAPTYQSSTVAAKREEARAQALEAARAKAEAMAKVYGLELGPVVSIREWVPEESYRVGRLNRVVALSDSPDPVLGFIPVESTVEVTFELAK